MTDRVRTEGTALGGGANPVRFRSSMVCGAVLFLASFPLLFWNEEYAIRAYRTLAEGVKSVVDVAADSVDAVNEGALVHVTGLALATNTLQDFDFAVSAAGALQLTRTVEMYQWQELADKQADPAVSGSPNTTPIYKYSGVWSERCVDSSLFKIRVGHVNPTSMPFSSQRWLSESVMLGAFRLPSVLVSQIDWAAPCLLATNAPLPAVLGGKGLHLRDGYYLGQDPASPEVGDVRIRFAVIKPTMVSVIALQKNGSFEPYVAHTGKAIEMLKAGPVTARTMFRRAKIDDKILSWLGRVVGFLVMLSGATLFLRSPDQSGGEMPFFGKTRDIGLGRVACTMAVSLSLMTIALAWFFYRPLSGIVLLALAIGVLCIGARRPVTTT